MAYNENLADRIREYLADIPEAEEKAMMGGLVFMVKGKMCIGIIKDEMMCRIDPEIYEDSLEKPGCRTMDFTGRAMRGYVLIDDSGMTSPADFKYWIDCCLDFNQRAKSSKKKTKKAR